MSLINEKRRMMLTFWLVIPPLIGLAYYFWGIEGATMFMALLAYGSVAMVILRLVIVCRHEWQTRQWKKRIQQIADCTDRPYEDYSFDEFCEITEDSELERTIEFLKQMPKGQRNLNEAYANVLAKYSGPN